MKLSVKHALRYSLGTPPRAVQHLLLTATSTPQQKVVSWTIEGPGLETAVMFRDGFGNRAHLVTLVKPAADLTIIVSGRVETFDKAGVLGRLDHDPSPAVFRRSSSLARCDPVLIEGLAPEGGRVAMLHALMDRVHETGSGTVQTQVQDGAIQAQSLANDAENRTHAFIGAARALDIPARYVTGYLHDEGAARFHCWAEAWDEGLGWIGFDPALNICPANGHIRIASGLDASSTLPIRSVPHPTEVPQETLAIEVDQEPST
jgi:transglutaminase-like putative cysteine protease